MKELVVAVTGASGAIYARRLLECAKERFDNVHLVISEHGREVVEWELGPVYGPDLDAVALLAGDTPVRCHSNSEVGSLLASGSSRWEAMVIVPCSMGTLAKIATGLSNDLISRAADVALKERRKLIVVPRETPLNLVHLRNMVVLTEAGGIVLPAMPGFYGVPREIGDLVDFVVQRIFNALGIEMALAAPWEGWPRLQRDS